MKLSSLFIVYSLLIFFQGKITLVNPDLKKFIGTSEGENYYFVHCKKKLDNANVYKLGRLFSLCSSLLVFMFIGTPCYRISERVPGIF